MKIREVIQNVKNYHGGTDFTGKPIDESNSSMLPS